MAISTDITTYNNQQNPIDKEICDLLFDIINKELTNAESKIWHAHPVWFLDGNPIVGYSKQKKGIRLMFWSGADFDEENLTIKGLKFKDASIFYTHSNDINLEDLTLWLKKSVEIQWDYKNIVKRKGKLERIIQDPLKNKYAKERSEKVKMAMSKQSPISHEEFLKRKP